MHYTDYIFVLIIITVGTALVLYTLSFFTNTSNRVYYTALRVIQGMVLVELLLHIIFRYMEVGYPPIRTLFESLMVLSLTICIIFLLIDRFYPLPLLGILTNILILGIVLYGFYRKDIDHSNIPASLQSFWFVPHVTVYFFGYGAFFLAGVAAVTYLISPVKTIRLKSTNPTSSEPKVIEFATLMHHLTVFGYVLITIGLIIGALWANDVWGSYWTWDPKENWALITFLLYTIYFHQRRQPNWSHTRAATLLIIGFGIVLFTYLGVSMLPTSNQSVHVYLETPK